MAAHSHELDDLEDLFENAPCGYVSADKDGRIGRANKTVAGWIGIEPQALVGRRFADLLTIGGKMFYETHFAPTLRMQGAFSEVALELACANGSKLPVLVNAVERRDEAGHPRFVRFTIFNASERRRYEKSLLNAKTQAEAASAAERAASELREQFLAVLGHDLRSPLGSILGGLRFLAREPLSERGRGVIALMEGSVMRASGLIDNVLDFARSRLGGGIGLSIMRNNQLGPVIEQAVAEWRTIAPERTIEMHIDLRQAVPADPGRIGQLVSNLVGNAVTHGSSETPVRIRAVTHDDAFELSVSNDGDPIPETAVGHLFEPFFRGLVHPNQQGLGLGLYIASEIAKAHGGSLTVSSTAVETRFTFHMPFVTSAEA